MNLNLMMNDDDDLKPRITVFGVGGAGGNAVNNMIEKQLDGCVFVVANTDAQALQQSSSEARIQLGPKVTEGLGAGAKPEVGARAAEETIEDIVDHLQGAHMCFITAGMGGGTGTGAAPIIAQAARQMGILTVGVVTKPFQFEGTKRMRQADSGVAELQKHVDTLIIIPNQNLFRLANEKTTFTEAFAMADDVLYQGVKGVTDLMVRPGLINLDFADVRAVMDEMGKAMMGTGEAEGENRAVQAAEKAIANPLLDEISLNGAKGVLINITGGTDLTLFELDEAANIIRDKVDGDANIIVGSTLDPSMEGAIRVSVVATGIDAAIEEAAPPAPRRRVEAAPAQQPARAEVEDVPPRRAASAPAPRIEEPAPRAEAPAEPKMLGDDDMPAPAYQPKEPVRASAPVDPIGDDAGDFIAPRSAAPRGTPPADVLERMRRAAAAQPGAAARAPSAPVRRKPEPDAAARGESRMAGLGRMIERMAGHNGEKPSSASIADRVSERLSARRQGNLDTDFDDLADDSQSDNAEIPAFLRRQAN
ncbi:cell division protein FtsZ [Paracoccus aerodenitrificans]|uniref:cell division protein FtsZ n=1 Tax=Paracoccus aerodenitrificans TaxID=3017781 RepID=UPI0022F10362|nr:cell division protein FtsZ [Paracoccus aerodenitrificans]WBU63382.1 cell division protein FtsZ [Paracoccus aerodenitrificans]